MYDYVPGKIDWLVNRRPIEGSRADEPTVGDLAAMDVVLCRLADPASEVRGRIDGSGYPFALVLSGGRVLLGRVAASALDGRSAEPVELLMDPGPKTYRPHKTAEGTAQELAERDLQWAIVTSPHGELIGVVSRVALETAVRERREAIPEAPPRG